jgi:N-acetylglucosaminyldiphosphoundecaprenol N-acetyl-beta-D-mannosaminyltransferase
MRRPLRIGLDLTLLRPDRVTGVERYAQNLALALLETEAEGFEWVLFFRYDVPPAFERHRGRCGMLVSPFHNRVLTDQLWLPAIARRARLDLLHFPAYPAPPTYRGRFVLTVHDAAMWCYPDLVSSGARHYYRRLFPQAIRRAERILTDSEFSGQELRSIFGLAPEQVIPVLPGLDPAFLEPPPARRERCERFVLTVGTIEPRKNLSRLIEAMDLLPERHAQVPLVVVGRKGWQDPAGLIRSLAPVRWLGAVEDAQLRELYQTATAFAFPSLYEGFGLPLLEAMAQGAPCLASQAGSLPEIGAESCLYADPTSAADWAEKLTRLLDEPELRQELSARGLERSRAFRWRGTARQTAELYRAFAARPRRVRILSTEIDRVTQQEAAERVAALVESGEGGLIVTPNVDHLLILRHDPEFQEIYRHASLVLADGMPLVWASWLLGRPLPERVAGSDLLPRLCALASRRGLRVFFLGGRSETLPGSLERLRQKFPQLPLAGAYAPPFGFEHDAAEEQRTLSAVLEAKPDLLFVCLGAPKQEKFLWRHRAELGGIVGIGVGISLDFLTGRIRRAPLWMRRAGLEWLHRLHQEPRRLLPRYVRDAAFPGLLLAQLVREGRQTARHAPERPLPAVPLAERSTQARQAQSLWPYPGDS